MEEIRKVAFLFIITPINLTGRAPLKPSLQLVSQLVLLIEASFLHYFAQLAILPLCPTLIYYPFICLKLIYLLPPCV